jgi:growth hormone-inducible transmembrane protein
MIISIALRQGSARAAPMLAQGSRTATLRTLATRGFHSSTAKPYRSRLPKISSSVVARNALARGGARTYMQQAQPAQQTGGSTIRKFVVGGAIFGGTLVAINAVFNRETRDDGGMPAYERDYLNDTFLHTGLGIGIIGLTARAMVRSGFAYRLMVTSPWAVAIGGLALSFGTMIGTRSIAPDK